MPNITFKTNMEISTEKEVSLKTKLGKAIETFPGKSETWLMLVFEDSQRMYFQGNNLPCALIEVQILGSASADSYNKMTAILTDIVSDELSISPKRIYVKYEEYQHWGHNRINF